MDYDLCKKFDTLRNYLPDDLSNSTTSDINNLGNAKNYCSNGEPGKTECKTDFDKIKAGCLWLFEQLFVENKKNISTVEYIIIWLGYKLNQKTYDEAKDLNDFYNKYIENNRHYINCKQGDVGCSNLLNSNTGYTNYKEIIDKRKKMLNINIKNMSKFYDAFKLLCNMYTELGGSNTENKTYLENASKFVKKYKELNDDSGNTKDEAYCQALSTLSIDYINFKSSCADSDDCNNIPSLTSTETEEIVMKSSGNICDDTPSLSIVKKLILALLIFSVISIFLGIFFKCSLFVLRKRAQKQYLREKLKK
ncbi:PIR protein [Plasmodium yoelii]|uniref:PIR protein n=3 Tax=Plasmodium yoelii TaxID=5861 RepID=A0AAE9WP63_PLAYO|nr:PIR protein [Plasmodium yoelii]EAA22921.1 putative yir1 protein [Plasmodium yoelii yoelii]WBY56496.1 PIR protein [Plasmodium yoelii yoelii]VTZ76994.1 PIR protein [Plasmodium yoelii]|eukprot:XP_034493460.1 PIR protein [Plasmodium yoelii]